jgi:hypothetical protein
LKKYSNVTAKEFQKLIKYQKKNMFIDPEKLLNMLKNQKEIDDINLKVSHQSS